MCIPRLSAADARRLTNHWPGHKASISRPVARPKYPLGAQLIGGLWIKGQSAIIRRPWLRQVTYESCLVRLVLILILYAPKCAVL